MLLINFTYIVLGKNHRKILQISISYFKNLIYNLTSNIAYFVSSNRFLNIMSKIQDFELI